VRLHFPDKLERDIVAKRRLRDIDQRLCTLADGLAMQVCAAIFRDDIVDKVARCDHASE
jgi:hypothetical protein